MVKQQKKPKVLIFDIGGVCMKSPFQAILEYELANLIPIGWINYAISQTKPNGYWHRLERGELELNHAWFMGWEKDLTNSNLWSIFCQHISKNNMPNRETPPPPRVEAEKLFWSMMEISHTPDPWIFPALVALRESEQFILMALSNTVPFPHSYNISSKNRIPELRLLFDIFISSSELGLRKPDPKIYAYALDRVDRFANNNAQTPRGRSLAWDRGINANEILFLDDIGENLKAGRQAGFLTIKVNLGRTWEAVDELESITGLKLAGSEPRLRFLPRQKKDFKL